MTLIDATLGMALVVFRRARHRYDCCRELLAWLVYRYLGLKFVSRGRFNLNATWASSLVLVGAL
jgi:hypothetical protein